MNEVFTFNIMKNGDRPLRGKFAEFVFDRLYRSKLSDRFELIPTHLLLIGGRRGLRKELRKKEIARAERLIKTLLAPNVFTVHDIQFLLTAVAHGRGPPSFDYVGIEKSGNKKVILDVKSGTKRKASLAFSSNERETIAKAKALAFNVYVAAVSFCQNWNVEMRLIEL